MQQLDICYRHASSSPRPGTAACSGMSLGCAPQVGFALMPAVLIQRLHLVAHTRGNEPDREAARVL
jgi:hypothetical protein